MSLKGPASVVKATALEVLSEPLTLLLALTALVLAVFAPAFHYHQFGEASRMARDAGLSAIFTCGSALAVFGAIRAFRRELETGTFEMALAHPVSRSGFFLAKAAGLFAAYLVFALTVFGAAVTIVIGATVAGRIAARTGEIATVWGPCLASGVAVAVVPLLVGAALNRFWRFRFVLTSMASALMLAIASAATFSFLIGTGALARLAPAVVLLAVYAALLASAASAFSVRFAANAAASLTGLVFAATLPFVGNYYMAEALSHGGSVPWSYVGLATLAAIPAAGAFLLLGCRFVRDIG